MIEKLQFKNVDFHYDPNASVFKGVSFEFPSDENVLITGESGSGKSVVLRLLGGLVSPITGEYWINDKNISDMNFEEFLPYRKQIGYSFDYGGLLANRTIRDNLVLPLQYHAHLSPAEIEERVAVMLVRFRLHTYADRRPAAVSGSVRKTTVIARSLIMHPELLLLDDPFTGLDREGVTVLLNLIDDHRKFRGLRHVFFTSRGESVSSKLATKTLIVKDQNLVLEVEPGKVVGL